MSITISDRVALRHLGDDLLRVKKEHRNMRRIHLETYLEQISWADEDMRLAWARRDQPVIQQIWLDSAIDWAESANVTRIVQENYLLNVECRLYQLRGRIEEIKSCYR